MRELFKKIILISIVVFGIDYLCEHTITMRYVIPISYRLDLSMVIVLLGVRYLENRKLIGGIFALKMLIGLLVATRYQMNAWNWIIQLSNIGLDFLLMLLALYLKESSPEVKPEIKKVLYCTGCYILCCVLANYVFLARIHAKAYGISMDDFFWLMHYYNNHVNGMGSFMVRCVLPFYIIQVGVYGLFYKLISSLVDGFHIPERE